MTAADMTTAIAARTARVSGVPATVGSSLSVFDLYSVGIGPSSSHTVGPMRAAAMFVGALDAAGELPRVRRVRSDLYGSLGATGRGHGSEAAVLLGLEGEDPATVDTAHAAGRLAVAARDGVLLLAGTHRIGIELETDLVLHRGTSLPGHPNGMTFSAFAEDGTVVREGTYYSVGGGFVVDEGGLAARGTGVARTPVPYPFSTGAELLAVCARTGRTVSDVMLANECAWRPEVEVRSGLLDIWRVMRECVEAGSTRDMVTDGTLPGRLRVPRRAPALHDALSAHPVPDQLHVIDWVNLFALAVNEENASGGRVVTAPTNGAAGILPAVLHYWVRFVAPGEGLTPDAIDDTVVRFLLTAAAIGILVKTGASISGAEVGCQGEVGSACAMAAGALCEALGGSPAQVENAAEIGVEHNLGLTCDPVGGLVQIPCIERNAIASTKAINAARLALHGDGSHVVSLDTAIRTLRDTGRDMSSRYKETSLGGLAVNVVEC